MGPGYPQPPNPFQSQMSYPNMDPMSAPFYPPGYDSYPHRHPMHMRSRHRSRRCRPVIHIIESSSCSSISTCATRSSCSRSCSHSRRYRTCQPQQQQQQQPIILLPIQCDQSQAAITGPFQGQQQNQGQQIIIPPIQIQQPGQPPRQLALPPIQLNSSSFMQNPTPMIISNGQSMMQPFMSMPQITTIGRPQQIQAGPIQYVQATPQVSQLQNISARSYPSIAPQRFLVNSTKRKHSTIGQQSQRPVTIHSLSQKNLKKHGRRSLKSSTRDRKRSIQSRSRRATRVG